MNAPHALTLLEPATQDQAHWPQALARRRGGILDGLVRVQHPVRHGWVAQLAQEGHPALTQRPPLLYTLFTNNTRIPHACIDACTDAHRTRKGESEGEERKDSPSNGRDDRVLTLLAYLKGVAREHRDGEG